MERKETQLLQEERDPILEALKHWCAYQDRSHEDVLRRCRKAGYSETRTQGLLAELIAGNFVNEARFAQHFAGGKFRLKKWGKLKIRKELRLHRVSEPNITEALELIDGEEYLRCLDTLFRKKLGELKLKGPMQQKAGLYRYLLSKGFEPELIHKRLQQQYSDHES